MADGKRTKHIILLQRRSAGLRMAPAVFVLYIGSLDLTFYYFRHHRRVAIETSDQEAPGNWFSTLRVLVSLLI